MLNPIEQMVEQQVRAWEVLDPAVLDAMQSISRENFLPEKFKKLANTDASIKLRDDFDLPCPSVQGKILQALQLEQNDSIYQIGAGTAYLSACLAFLGGHVTVAEANEETVKVCADNCVSLDLKNINVVQKTWLGALEIADKKYDAIVSQYAFTNTPAVIKNALKLNGRAVIFTGNDTINECVVIERVGENEWLESQIFETQVSSFPNKTNTEFNF